MRHPVMFIGLVCCAASAGAADRFPKNGSGLQLTPPSATIAVSTSQTLSISDCGLKYNDELAPLTKLGQVSKEGVELAPPVKIMPISKEGVELAPPVKLETPDDDLAPLGKAGCRSTAANKSLVAGACNVNGVTGGNDRLGQVSYQAATHEVIYRAPAKVPKPDTVTVGCQVRTDAKPLFSQGPQYLLTALVTVVGPGYVGEVGGSSPASYRSASGLAYRFSGVPLDLKFDPDTSPREYSTYRSKTQAIITYPEGMLGGGNPCEANVVPSEVNATLHLQTQDDASQKAGTYHLWLEFRSLGPVTTRCRRDDGTFFEVSVDAGLGPEVYSECVLGSGTQHFDNPDELTGAANLTCPIGDTGLTDRSSLVWKLTRGGVAAAPAR